MKLGIGIIEDYLIDLYGNNASAGHGILGIYCQIHKDLTHLPDIGPSTSSFAEILSDLDFNVFADCTSEHLAVAGHHLGKIQNLHLKNLLAAEGK